MEFRNVGKSGLKVSALGIGCNNFGGRLDESQSTEVIHAALDEGVTLFDTADVYPMTVSGTSEKFLRKGLGSRRNDVVLATKFGMPMDQSRHMQGGSRRYIINAVEASLKRLGTDWIDLLQFHKPDPDTPIDETLSALDDLIRSGKVRYIGSSNVSAWQVVEAQHIARELGVNRFVVTQEHYSLLERTVEDDVVPVCEKYGVGLLPFFPLASGVLSGKHPSVAAPVPGSRLQLSKPLADLFLTDRNVAYAQKLSQIAADAGHELIDLAFSWLLRSPVVPSVIAGASNAKQVQRNARATDWMISSEVKNSVKEALA